MTWKKFKGEKIDKENSSNIKVEFKSPKEFKFETLSVGIFGLSDTGKTHFSLTAPEPIYLIDTEGNANKVAYKFKDKEIYICDVRVLHENEIDFIKSVELIEEATREIVGRAIEYTNETGKKGTIVIDSITDVWSWLGIWLEEIGAERFTKSGQIMRTEWGKANRRYFKDLYRILSTDWNLVLTARVQEKYSPSGEPLGIYTGRWQKDTEHWVDVVLRAEKVDRTKRLVRLEKCRYIGDLQFEIVNGSFNDVFKKLKEKFEGGAKKK